MESCAGEKSAGRKVLDIFQLAGLLQRGYPKPGDRPRDECDAVAEQLLDTLGEGFEAGGVWLPIDDAIEVDTSQGVLVAQFGVSWVETAAETGEYMETLNYNREELTI